MSSSKKLDPTGERAEATEAMESTPISGKDHEYQADGDHRPRQGTAVEGGNAGPGSQAGTKADGAPKVGVQTERHISEGVPGAGRSPEVNSMAAAPREGDTRV
jgi:hypothetical protein